MGRGRAAGLPPLGGLGPARPPGPPRAREGARSRPWLLGSRRAGLGRLGERRAGLHRAQGARDQACEVWRGDGAFGGNPLASGTPAQTGSQELRAAHAAIRAMQSRAQCRATRGPAGLIE